MTATPETISTETQHHFLTGLAQQGGYAHRFAKAGQTAEALEHLGAIERLADAYREAAGVVERQAIHRHFGLSYANYLVVPRTLLQSMPDVWQAKFVALLDQLDEAFAHIPRADVYDVTAGKEDLLRDMTETELYQAGVEVTGDDELGHGPDTVYRRISDGAVLEGDSYGFRPGVDPVPPYNRARIEPRLDGGA
jgi:hypothetical protein